MDLLVEFAPIGEHARFHAYFEPLDELQSVLGTKVDLFMSGAIRNAIIAREPQSSELLDVSSLIAFIEPLHGDPAAPMRKRYAEPECVNIE